MAKPQYEPPQLIDLSAGAWHVGFGSCNMGSGAVSACSTGGAPAGRGDCDTGMGAYLGCTVGNSASGG